MDKYYCTICMKNYAIYGSLWNHNNKFHNTSKNNDINLHKNYDKSNPNYDKSNPNYDKSNPNYDKSNLNYDKSNLKNNKSNCENNKNLINKKDFDKLQCKNKKSRFFIFRFLKKY